MCGIVGAVAQRDVDLILMEGLRRLEYRGYDSAGIAVITRDGELSIRRTVGKVAALQESLDASPLTGPIGLAHTRWATHGEPSEKNAHPHVSHGRVALVHNGIIENYQALRRQLVDDGVQMASDTDTEVAAHLINKELSGGKALPEAVVAAGKQLKGAFAIAVIDREDPNVIVGIRRGSPLVVGIGLGEHFLASDAAALVPVTQRMIYLEDGDVAVLGRRDYRILDGEGNAVEREVSPSTVSADAAERQGYRHFMQKEIHEQPEAVAHTLEGRITDKALHDSCFSEEARDILGRTEAVHIVACGTSFHAGLVARYWIESLARIPCTVEIASEYRYREPAVPENTLFLTISQSGETADTLAALREAKNRGYLASLAICNVRESTLERESDLVLMTRAGTEIGVASTKAFTTQLVALMLVCLQIARQRGLSSEKEAEVISELRALPDGLREVLELEDDIIRTAQDFMEKEHALFLGRGADFPIAMEGALKLKEISYIHAEAYAAGELKHGPLALVDEHLPVVVTAASNHVLEKLLSNLQEVRARGGRLYVFADKGVDVDFEDDTTVIRMPCHHGIMDPVLHTIPLQLLSYHVAVLRGTDVDQPRNLAKSVTVE